MQRTQDWLREAEAELQAANDLYAHGHWWWCCFTCQQAAEKAIKAIGEHLRHSLSGHNLNMLVQALMDYIAIPESIQRACARLNRYYIPTRYPNAFDRGAPVDQFIEDDANGALQDARAILEFAKGVIGAS